jgi:small subunit ribosomal protein S1
MATKSQNNKKTAVKETKKQSSKKEGEEKTTKTAAKSNKTSIKSTAKKASPKKVTSTATKKTATEKVVDSVAVEKETVAKSSSDGVTASEVKKASKTAKKASGKAPTSMEELLDVTGYELKAPKPGQVLEGMVTEISRKMVLVDIGAKTEGMVVDKEFAAAKDFIEDISIGDEVSVYVLSPENERGQILLSLKRALIDKRWEQFTEYMETGEAVTVEGLEVNKGGMIVMAKGIRGFVPSSQFGSDYLGQMEKLLGDTFKVKVIEVNKEKNRLIFSERHVSEAEAIAKKTQALQYVVEGEIYEGVVSGIMPFGVFVSVEVPLTGEREGESGKVEGLVHISEISWEKVNDPNDYFKLGDRVKVKVLGIDQEAGKLNLSVKQLSADPWDSVVTNYPQGAKVTGRVTRTAPFGVFVTLEAGVDGLIHISKVPADAEPKVGEDVEVFVESVDPEQRRMSLGMVLTEVPMGYK